MGKREETLAIEIRSHIVAKMKSGNNPPFGGILRETLTQRGYPISGREAKKIHMATELESLDPAVLE
ncbi:MAG: hypothetical protein HYY20_00935 [Candidatus Tectomicrobia bacterium]|uniref:Uncharacterized protein n=1 Tax=Tectimicrobiota bacterium TaxID=2528274 RepID=A0A932CLB7_UNCTE|nr:hypothetical protein [Candidatus Tectomicrobia bacterium]